MIWTQIRVECALSDLDTVTAVMSMVDNSLMIEDYSDVSEGINEIYGELLDEDIINKDKTRAAVSVYLSEDRHVGETEEMLRARFASLGIEADITSSGLREEDWANCWKKYYKPLHIGKNITVVPMWEEYCAQPGEVIVKMDPGMAFGTGTHETTALCAELIEKYLNKGARVLDVGTGSGILAVLASKLGASGVDALDIDENAVRVAKENCEKNQVRNVCCRKSDLVSEADGQYDFVSANIVADIILRLAGDIGDYIKPGSVMVLSGIIASQAQEVISAFERRGFVLLERLENNDWNAFAFRKRS